MHRLAAAALAASLAAMASAAPAGAEADVKIGLLKCEIDGGVGFIVGSQKAINCTFRQGRGIREHYSGTITKFGADIGMTTGSHLVWGVFAPGQVGPGALAGFYIGATGEATVGVGPGANVLFGGFENSVNLQPLSLQGQMGLNVAGGIAGLRLEPSEVIFK